MRNFILYCIFKIVLLSILITKLVKIIIISKKAGRNLEVMDMITVMFSKCVCTSKGLKLCTLHMCSFLYVKKKGKKEILGTAY